MNIQNYKELELIGKELKQIISPKISEISENEYKTLIKNIRIKIENYLEKANQIQSSIYRDLEFARKDPNWIENEESRFGVAKNYLIREAQAEKIVKQGYVLIDILRENFTGEPILYQIGVEYYGKLYEGKVPLSKLMEVSSLQAQWRNTETNLFKLRITASRSRLIEILGGKNNSLSSHQGLYQKIKKESYKYGTRNKGNIYETYGKAKLEGRQRLSEKLYKTVRENIDSFVKGGDLNNEQYKFFGGSIASLYTIIKALTYFNKILMVTTNMENIKTGLSALFEKSPTFNSISNDFVNFSKENFQLLIQEMKKL